MMYSGRERRRHLRVDLSIVIRYRVLGQIAALITAKTKNVSAGGFLLSTEKQIPVNTSLLIEIPLPKSSDFIQLIGRVIESYLDENEVTYNTRLEFLAIDEAHKKIINNIIELYSSR